MLKFIAINEKYCLNSTFFTLADRQTNVFMSDSLSFS